MRKKRKNNQSEQVSRDPERTEGSSPKSPPADTHSEQQNGTNFNVTNAPRKLSSFLPDLVAPKRDPESPGVVDDLVWGPGDIASQLLANESQATVAFALIDSVRDHLKRTQGVLLKMARFTGEEAHGMELLRDLAIVLGIEGMHEGDEDAERGKPISMPVGDQIAVRGLLGHFYPTLEERSEWPEATKVTHGLTCADIVLGRLPDEFGHQRCDLLVDWARAALRSVPKLVCHGNDTDERTEFDLGFRQNVLFAVRHHLVRLTAWVKRRVDDFIDLVAPVLRLTPDGVRITMGGDSEPRPLGPAVNEMLTELLDKRKFRAVPKTKSDLLKKLPELSPFIGVAAGKDAAGRVLYKLSDVIKLLALEPDQG